MTNQTQKQASISAPAPRVSVLMPVYNAADFLGEAVDSILQQSFNDFELIAVDDGSTDSSNEILQQHAAKDSRVKIFINDGNRGIVFTLNRGIAQCRGEFIARMDADDIALPERLAKQVDHMERHPEVPVLGGALSYIDAAGQDLGLIRKVDLGSSLLAANPLFHPTVMIRKAALAGFETSYEERFRYAEDYYLWLKLSRFGPLDSLDDLLIKYRISSQATRIRHLKGVLLATLRVKMAGIFSLGIRPTLVDLLRLLAEGLLMLLPASVIMQIYIRTTFGAEAKKLKL